MPKKKTSRPTVHDWFNKEGPGLERRDALVQALRESGGKSMRVVHTQMQEHGFDFSHGALNVYIGNNARFSGFREEAKKGKQAAKQAKGEKSQKDLKCCLSLVTRALCGRGCKAPANGGKVDCGGSLCKVSKKLRSLCVLGCSATDNGSSRGEGVACGGQKDLKCCLSLVTRALCGRGCKAPANGGKVDCGGSFCKVSKKSRSLCVLGCSATDNGSRWGGVACGGGLCNSSGIRRNICGMGCGVAENGGRVVCGNGLCPFSNLPPWYCKGSGDGHLPTCGSGLLLRSLVHRVLGLGRGKELEKITDKQLEDAFGCTVLQFHKWIEGTYFGNDFDGARKFHLIQLDHQRPVNQIAELLRKGGFTLDSPEVKELQTDICHWSNFSYIATSENQTKSAKYPKEFAVRLEVRRDSLTKTFKEAEAKGFDGMDAAIKFLRAKKGDDRFGLMPADYLKVRKAEDARRMGASSGRSTPVVAAPSPSTAAGSTTTTAATTSSSISSPAPTTTTIPIPPAATTSTNNETEVENEVVVETARKQEEGNQRALDELATLEEAMKANEESDNSNDDGVEEPMVVCDVKEKEERKECKRKKKEAKEVVKLKKKKKKIINDEEGEKKGQDEVEKTTNVPVPEPMKSDDKKPVKVKKVIKELPPRKSGRARKPKKIDDDFVTGDDEEDLN
ncbi:hypothetical protein TrCOL_g11890 [Triparma columacea]|uniref:Uncharacterized protein n=1 Tax=Triparma columacea TaxID=722753 RepID=A0A9W7GAR8_9STRA|nr:hypothetical protein TrCOL_g11890 [Triparma columacea]